MEVQLVVQAACERTLTEQCKKIVSIAISNAQCSMNN